MPPFLGSVLGPLKCQGMSLLMPLGLDIDLGFSPCEASLSFWQDCTPQKSAASLTILA